RGIDGGGGEELVTRGEIVVDAHRRGPGEPTVGGAGKEHVGVVGAGSLVRPYDVDVAAIRRVAGIAERGRKPVAAGDAGHAEVPATRLRGHRHVPAPGGAAIQGPVEQDAAGARPGEIDLPLRTDRGNRALYRVVGVLAVPGRIVHAHR